jgi:hypothetical protein
MSMAQFKQLQQEMKAEFVALDDRTKSRWAAEYTKQVDDRKRGVTTQTEVAVVSDERKYKRQFGVLGSPDSPIAPTSFENKFLREGFPKDEKVYTGTRAIVYESETTPTSELPGHLGVFLFNRAGHTGTLADS